mgnify:CR=1 FL=1
MSRFDLKKGDILLKGQQSKCIKCGSEISSDTVFCPICGKKLEHFDDDSQGGRGYCCPSTTHNYFTWVSYKFIDTNFGK